MTDTTPGRAAYEAYADVSNWKSLVSDAYLPEWIELDERIRYAWDTAGAAAVMASVPGPLRDRLAAVAANNERLRDRLAAVTAERDALRQAVTELAEQWGIAAGADDCEFDHDLGDLGRAHAAALRKLTAERNAIEAYETRKAARS